MAVVGSSTGATAMGVASACIDINWETKLKKNRLKNINYKITVVSRSLDGLTFSDDTMFNGEDFFGSISHFFA